MDAPLLIDTHCHINVMANNGFDKPLTPEAVMRAGEIIAQAQTAGVGQLVCVGTNLVESQNCVTLACAYSTVYAVVGIHPCDATPTWSQDLQQLKLLVHNKEQNRIVAIGEIGLDFYHKPFDVQRQADAFKAQLELALAYDLPVVIHVRDAGQELLQLMEPYTVHQNLRGVIHCFSQDGEFAQQVLAWGFYVGLDAPIAYPKNTALRHVVQEIPLERIVLETDAPFLPPQQLRGKPNQPAYLPYVATAVADIKAVSVQCVAQQTTANACALFGIPNAVATV